MFVNLPIAGFALLVTVFAVRSQHDEDRSPIDLTGALLATAGLCAVVYGLSAAKTHAWSGPGTLVPLGVGIVLLAAFAVVENRRRASLPALVAGEPAAECGLSRHAGLGNRD